MKLRTFYLLVFLFIIPACYAQDHLKTGLAYLDDLQFRKARNFFLDQLKVTEDAATIYCLLGDTYLGMELADSAKMMYLKALEADAKSAFPYIGLGKVALLQGDRTGETEFFEKARKTDRKNPAVYAEIANGCFELSKKDTAMGNVFLKQGLEGHSNYAPLHICSGDYESLAGRFGNAVNAYERALFFDATSTVACRKLGLIHSMARSYRDAINAFNKSIDLKSDQVLVYKNLGDLYYLLGRYGDAEKNYQIYMDRAEISLDDKERYAIILFFNKKYTESARLLEEVMTVNSDESVLLRIRGYIACETGDKVNGLAYMEKFFKLHNPEKNIASDYFYYGKLLQDSGKDTLAIQNYKKALLLDSTKTELYDNLAKLYAANKMHVEAVINYKKMIARGADKVNTWFLIGKEYYFEGDNYRIKYDSLMNLHKSSKITFSDSLSVFESSRNFFLKADSAFSQVTMLNPQYAGGFIWKGRINSLLDPEAMTGIAKDAYEKALALLEPGDQARNRKSMIECYKYLGSYFFLNSERLTKTDQAQSEMMKNTSINYFRKILTIDPTDSQSLEVFKRLKIAL